MEYKTVTLKEKVDAYDLLLYTKDSLYLNEHFDNEKDYQGGSLINDESIVMLEERLALRGDPPKTEGAEDNRIYLRFGILQKLFTGNVGAKVSEMRTKKEFAKKLLEPDAAFYIAIGGNETDLDYVFVQVKDRTMQIDTAFPELKDNPYLSKVEKILDSSPEEVISEVIKAYLEKPDSQGFTTVVTGNYNM